MIEGKKPERAEKQGRRTVPERPEEFFLSCFRGVIEILDDVDSVSTHIVKTNRADLRKDIEKAAGEIGPCARGAIIFIKFGMDGTLEDAEAAVGEIRKHLPSKAHMIWHCSIHEEIPEGGVEIRCFVGYRKAGGG